MPSMCVFCKKIALPAHNVSHANNKTKTHKHPNLQKVRAFFDGKVQKITACTRCIRSGKVTKAA